VEWLVMGHYLNFSSSGLYSQTIALLVKMSNAGHPGRWALVLLALFAVWVAVTLATTLATTLSRGKPVADIPADASPVRPAVFKDAA
jgi:hypothetical protein